MREKGEQAAVLEWKEAQLSEKPWTINVGENCIQIEYILILPILQFCFHLGKVFAKAKTIK